MTVTMATSSCFQFETDISVGPVVSWYVGLEAVIHVWGELLGSLLITGVNKVCSKSCRLEAGCSKLSVNLHTLSRGLYRPHDGRIGQPQCQDMAWKNYLSKSWKWSRWMQVYEILRDQPNATKEPLCLIPCFPCCIEIFPHVMWPQIN